ncbi:MAG: DUF817 domain-containing protein [Bacteroidetes bacterium]|nr:DUF817 domain-containing protein [Bacteroidota bacterium]
MSKIKSIFKELLLFAIKQANAAIFGGILLCAIIATKYISTAPLYRYDFLFLVALVTQAILITFKIESGKEILMIAVFHILATGMELFKTSPNVGSWYYPGTAYFMLYTVPLFAGFMYSAVGSYIARAWKIFKFKFTHYPKFSYPLILGMVSYVNFITHHFFFDFRYILFVASAVVFWKTKIHFTIIKTPRQMPLLLGFTLVAIFIWIAENISTFTSIWLYPNQTSGWQSVPLGKLGSWYLLIIVSFVLISSIYRKTLRK